VKRREPAAAAFWAGSRGGRARSSSLPQRCASTLAISNTTPDAIALPAALQDGSRRTQAFRNDGALWVGRVELGVVVFTSADNWCFAASANRSDQRAPDICQKFPHIGFYRLEIDRYVRSRRSLLDTRTVYVAVDVDYVDGCGLLSRRALSR